MVDDTERRLNALFDALNCDTLSSSVVNQLNELTEGTFQNAFCNHKLNQTIVAIASRDQQRALAIHVDLLTNGSQTEGIGLWMSAIKQLIMRI